jgi:shikimate kinase
MKENIALIGLMGSGKTTIGRELAKALEMKFIDIDSIITTRENRNIVDIFNDEGEEYFRKLERTIIDEESKKNNIVISTGGGVIIDNSNIKNLRKTSYVIYLDSSLECIYERVKNGKKRPLLNDIDDLYKKIEELYEQRNWLYKISCDFTVEIVLESSIQDTVDIIKKAYIKS